MNPYRLFKLISLTSKACKNSTSKKHPKADQRTKLVMRWVLMPFGFWYLTLFVQHLDTKLQQSWKGGSELISIEPECKEDIDIINEHFKDRMGGLDWNIKANNLEVCIDG